LTLLLPPLKTISPFPAYFLFALLVGISPVSWFFWFACTAWDKMSLLFSFNLEYSAGVVTVQFSYVSLEKDSSFFFSIKKPFI